MQHLTIEVCASTLQSCLAALESGADRVELCSALAEGGVTPSYALIKAACALEGLRVHVLIRPRGGDFCYSQAEVALMCEDIRCCRRLGAQGVVIGALTPEGELDAEAIRPLILAATEPIDAAPTPTSAHPLTLVFHRAFDCCRDPKSALEQLVAWGFDTVLTSGQAATAPEGAALLTSLVHQAAGRIHIMAGSGINPSNAAALARATGVDALHLSARALVKSPSTFYPKGANPPSFGGVTHIPNFDYYASSAPLITQVIQTVNHPNHDES